MTRAAIVYNAPPETVASYLPDNYHVVGPVTYHDQAGTMIAGADAHGWTLHDYVLPRLASGMIYAIWTGDESAARILFRHAFTTTEGTAK